MRRVRKRADFCLDTSSDQAGNDAHEDVASPNTAGRAGSQCGYICGISGHVDVGKK